MPRFRCPVRSAGKEKPRVPADIFNNFYSRVCGLVSNNVEIKVFTFTGNSACCVLSMQNGVKFVGNGYDRSAAFYNAYGFYSLVELKSSF